MTLCALILAGGAGTRLWPHSRTSTPKQFLSLVGERTMLLSLLEARGEAGAPRG
jgi:mannose-1-phosphate guanylyltransferase